MRLKAVMWCSGLLCAVVYSNYVQLWFISQSGILSSLWSDCCFLLMLGPLQSCPHWTWTTLPQPQPQRTDHVTPLPSTNWQTLNVFWNFPKLILQMLLLFFFIALSLHHHCTQKYLILSLFLSLSLSLCSRPQAPSTVSTEAWGSGGSSQPLRLIRGDSAGAK